MNILTELLMKNSEFPAMIITPYIETNHRKTDRFAINTADVCALMSWSGSHGFIFPVKLIDINKKGCGIHYLTEKMPSNVIEYHAKCNLKFFGRLDMLEIVDNTVIYDFEIKRYSTERISVRRCGIRFKEFVEVNR